jgi:hypothetical protein
LSLVTAETLPTIGANAMKWNGPYDQFAIHILTVASTTNNLFVIRGTINFAGIEQ